MEMSFAADLMTLMVNQRELNFTRERSTCTATADTRCCRVVARVRDAVR